MPRSRRHVSGLVPLLRRCAIVVVPLLRRHAIALLSVAGHGALLAAVVMYQAGTPRPPPQPESIAVDIVPASELPDEPPPEHVEGTPLESNSHGSEMASDAPTGSAGVGPSRPRMTAPPSLQQQAAASQPASGSVLAAPAGDTMALPPPSPDPASQPQEQQQPPQQPLPDALDRLAMMMSLPGAKTATGSDPPSSQPAMLPHDDTAAFRTRLSECSRAVAERGLDANTAILLRVSFKRDGSLAAPPQLLQSPLSVDAVELTRIAVTALERCQPFHELPPDKYRRWKTLELVVTPVGLLQ